MVFESMGQFMSKIMFFHGYVNEYNGFPKPLSREKEEYYIDQMLAGDQNARDMLINHNMRLVAHVSKKFTGAAEADDLLSVGSIGLIKGINSYKKDKGSQLSTYVSRCIENEILMLIRANKKHKACTSIEEVIGFDKDGTAMTLKEIIPQSQEEDPEYIVERKVLLEEVIEVMKNILDKREYHIICLRYGLNGEKEHTQSEVARLLNISRSYVSRIETHAIELLSKSFKPEVENGP